MALTTGSPSGTITSQEELYIEGSPYIYIQDYEAGPLYNPDAEGFYWGMSGTASYPVFALGCIQDVSLTEGMTMNDVRCDTVGVKDTIQRRDYVEFNLTILSHFPLSVLSKLLNLSTAVVGTGEESVGIGRINNNKFYHAYAPKVYDNDANDYLVIDLHKCKFVDAWTINMNSGESWTTTGIKLRAYADETKPDTALFGTIKRFDASAIA
jgi:hypothetical protein